MLHWGEMGGQWGVNRSVSQIHALLYPVRAADDRGGHRRHARDRALQRVELDQGAARLEPDPARAGARRPARSLRGRDRHLGSLPAHRGRAQGARDRSCDRGAQDLQRGSRARRRRERDRAHAAQRDARLHRDDGALSTRRCSRCRSRRSRPRSGLARRCSISCPPGGRNRREDDQSHVDRSQELQTCYDLAPAASAPPDLRKRTSLATFASARFSPKPTGSHCRTPIRRRFTKRALRRQHHGLRRRSRSRRG